MTSVTFPPMNESALMIPTGFNHVLADNSIDGIVLSVRENVKLCTVFRFRYQKKIWAIQKEFWDFFYLSNRKRRCAMMFLWKKRSLAVQADQKI
jgi:hypothetical protein